MKASYLHNLVSNKTTVVAEIAHKLSKNENTFTIGSSYAVDTFTTVKGRVNNYGKVAALVQHEWRPKSVITISGEVDTDKKAKVGVSVAMKP